MPRPATKTELLAAANTQYDKMLSLVDAMPENEQIAEFCFDADKAGKEAHWKRDKNIRDLFVHLYEWHQLLLKWVNANQKGEGRPFLPEPYNWKTYGEMNVGFWEMHRSTSYSQSREMLKQSHNAAVALIGTFGDEELFTKNHFTWTGGSTLGSYCISVTSSHYDWAMKKVKAQIKALKGV